MNDEQIQALMMKVVDGQATPEEQKALEDAISESEKWQTELRAYRKIKEVTDKMQFKELPDSYWEGYWQGVYRQIERGLGWILMSIGAIIVLAFCLYAGLCEFYADPDVSLILKIGVSFGGFGVIVLLVSILRERLFARKHERYEKEVKL